MVEYPQRLSNFLRRVAGLQEGRYIITLTIKPTGSIYSVSEMGQLENQNTDGPIPKSNRPTQSGP